MTLEEMQAVARKAEAALKNAGFTDVEYVEEHEPGDPLPIMATLEDETFVFELSPA